jgi:serine/threonine protein kinase
MDSALVAPAFSASQAQAQARGGRADLMEALGKVARGDHADAESAAELLSRCQLTHSSIIRVLAGLASDPMSFEARYRCGRAEFTREVTAAYQRLHDARTPDQASDGRLRGVLGFIVFTITALRVAAGTGGAEAAELGQLQDLLDDGDVRAVFYELYRPAGRPRPGPAQQAPAASDLARAHWKALEPASLRVHRVGTTSFILTGNVTVLGGELLALKCVLFPYTQVPAIADATRKYADDYPGGKVPCTVVVHSSTDKWILMDLVPGPTLQEVLDREVPGGKPATGPAVRAGLVTTIGSQLLDALYSLHSAGFEHRDLTPSNVIVVAKPGIRKPDGTVESGVIERLVFLDLGRNHLFTRQTDAAERREARFVAPEVKDGHPEARSDAYSLGMILAELADAEGAVGGILPDSLYRHAPYLARFIEDLIDADPENRLLIFKPGSGQDLYEILRSAFADEVRLLASDEKAALADSAWARALVELLLPSSRQVGHRFRLWRQMRSAHAEIDEYSGYLLAWSVISTAAWFAIFSVALLWGLRDVGVDAWSTSVSVLQKVMGTSTVPGVDDLRAAGYQVQDWRVNLPAALLAFSIGLAGTKYYQNILAGLTVRAMSGRRAFLTEAFIRYTSFAVLAPALIGNLVQPQWWPWLAGIGYIPATITSYLCHSLARRSLRGASTLSTVRTAPDPVLQAYGQWSSSMGFLALALLGLALGMRLHMVHDVWVYTASLCAVNVVIMYAVKSVYFGPSVRGSLTRAFLAGARREMARRVRQQAPPVPGGAR